MISLDSHHGLLQRQTLRTKTFLRACSAALKNRISLVVAGSVLVAASAIVAGSPAVSAATPNYEQVIANEAAFVASGQVHCQGEANGAIASYGPWSPNTTSVPVNAYYPAYGVHALIAADSDPLVSASAKATYMADAKAWFQWYLNNMNTGATHATNPFDIPGTVYDYTANPSTCAESGNTYGASDAGAGVFLWALEDYSLAPNANKAWLQSEASKIQEAASAPTATLQRNGLTEAVPWTGPPAPYPLEYLLDNTEVYMGWASYAWLLAGVLNNPTGADYVAQVAQNLSTSISTNLAPGTSGLSTDAYGYYYAEPLTGTGSEIASSWTNCGEAEGQMWPIFAGFGTLTQRENALTYFTFVYNNVWDTSTPAYPDIYCPGSGTNTGTTAHDTEASVTYAAAVLGQAGDTAAKADADAGINGLEQNWVSAGRPYPWNVGDSGALAMAAALQEQ